VHTTLGTPHEEKEQRERKTISLVAIIKSMDEECMNLCEEIMQLWTKLTKDLTMKVIEERLGNAQENA
jgi:hypothetical protein